MNQNIAITGGTGSFTNGPSIDTLILDRLQSAAAAPDNVALASGSKVPGSILNEVNITGSATSITMTGVYAIDVNMYGGTLDAGDLGPVGAFTVKVTGEASPASDPNHVIIEPPLKDAPDNLTVDTGLSVQDTATETNYLVTGLVAQDDVRIKLNGGGSETVNDIQTLGPYTLIFDGSDRSAGGNTLNVPLVVPSFVATVNTDAMGDPEVQLGGGLVSFHGSASADLISITDQIPLSAASRTTSTFDVVDDSALLGTLSLVGNPTPHAEIGDTFNVSNTAITGLLTKLTGGVGLNFFDIDHGGVNQNIVITGGPGGNTLTLDRPQSSASAPDSVALAAVTTQSGPAVSVTGSATSIIMSGVYLIDVNMYGGTLDAGDLGPVGAFTVNVTGKASPAGDPSHVIIEPPLQNAPDNVTVDTGLSVQDLATDTSYSMSGLVAQDDVRIKLNGGGSETVNDIQTLGPYTLIFDGSRRSSGGNTLNVPLVAASFVATVVTDGAGDPELQVASGLVSFHGSTPADLISVTDQIPLSAASRTTSTFDVVDDSALLGTLSLVGNPTPHAEIGDTFNVTNTAATGLLTKLTGGVGLNFFDIIHGGVNQNIAITGGPGGNTLILDRPQSSASAPDSVALAAVTTQSGPAVSVTGSATSIIMSGVYLIDVNMYGGTLDAGDLGPVGAFTVNVTGKASPAGDPNHVIIEPPSSGAPDNATIDTGLSIADSATNTNYEITQFIAQDDIRLKINGGGSETVYDPETLGPYTLIIDGAVRANAQDPAGNLLTVVNPYETGSPNNSDPDGLAPAGSITSMVTDAAGDPEIVSGPNNVATKPFDEMGQVAVHGSIARDTIDLNIPEQLSTWGSGFAQPPTATNQISLDASALAGTLNVNVVPANPTASGPWYFTNTYLNINAVNPLVAIVFNGLDHKNFPYPDATDVSNSGQGIVTVGDGQLSQIDGNVTINNAQLTVNNTASTDKDILTMTATTLGGWSVPVGVAPPTLSFSPILYNTLLVEAGNDENIDVEEMPTIDVLTEVGSEYETFDGNDSVTFQNTATSAAPDSVFVVATNPADILSVDGDYSLYVGRRLQPDGIVVDLGTASENKAPIVFDYTGTDGNANFVFDASTNTNRIDGELFAFDAPYIVAPAGDLVLGGVFATTVYGGILFNPSNINVEFDSDLSTGSINNGGDTLDIADPGLDSVIYNATPVTGITQIANHVIIENSGTPITINGNGNTEVDFSQDSSNDFSLYAGVQADVSINDASIEIEENSETLPDVVLTGDSLAGATTGAINFTNLTGFTFQTNPATPMTMTVVDTPASITTNLDLTNTNLTVQATTGPLDVAGSEGHYPDSEVTIGDGTLANIDGNITITGFGSAASTGIIATILDQDAGPASNVMVTSSSSGAETITGLIPATIAFNGQSALSLYTPADSTDTVYQSVDTFNLYAGAGSTVNLDHAGYSINDLTVLGAAQVNVAQGDPTFIDYGAGAAGSLNIEADPARPTATTSVTINATAIGGYQLTLGDGLEGFNSFQYGLAGSTPDTINLQASAVVLTLELPNSVVNHLAMTVNDTGALLTTIDEGAVPVTVAGTTGPLTLVSSYPGTITLGSAGSVQGLNGAVDVETPTLPSTAGMLIIADSADTTARSVTVMPATGGVDSITELAPAPIDYTAAGYALSLSAGTGNNTLDVNDTASGAGMTLNTGPGNNTVDVNVSGTGGFAPITVNGGAGSDALFVAGDGDNPVVYDYPSATQPQSGKIVASYPPAGPTRTVNYTGISSFGSITTPPLITTTTVLTPATATVPAGHSVVFTATVSSTSGTPSDGGVQFLVNGSDVGSPVTVSAGVAKDSIAEPIGVYAITAQYTGDSTTYGASPVSTAASLNVYAPVSISSITGVANPTNHAQSNIEVTFSAPIKTSGLTTGALTLSLNNGGNLAGNSLTLTLVSGTTSTYAIGGFSSLTAAQGSYKLTVNAADILDQNGFAGTGSTSVTWLMDSTAPTSSVVNALGSAQTSDTFPVPVSFSDPTGSGGTPASGVATLELFVSINGGSFIQSESMTLSTPGTAGTATFSFAGADRNSYSFYSIAIDAAGNTESRSSTTAEASTSVPDLNPPITHVLSSSMYTNGAFTLNWSGTDPDQNTGKPPGSINLVNIYVIVDNGTPALVGQVSAGTPGAGGLYSGSLSYSALADGEAHTYGFYSIGIDDQGKVQATPGAPDVTFSGVNYEAPLAVQPHTSPKGVSEDVVVEKGIAEQSFIQYLDVDFNQTTATNAALSGLAAELATTSTSRNSYVELLWYGENLTSTSTAQGSVNLFNAGTTATVGLTGNDLSINFGPGGITSLLSGVAGKPTSNVGDGWYALGIDPTGNPANGQTFWVTFFRLFGDTDGDGVVTGPYTTAGTDAYNVYHAEGTSGTLLDADVDGSGAVNSKDLAYTVAAKGDSVGVTPPTSFPQFQLLAGPSVPAPASPVSLGESDVRALLPQAIAAWQLAGLSAADLRMLESVKIDVANLGTGILGLEAADTITINQTAAGYNWYLGGASIGVSGPQVRDGIALAGRDASRATSSVDLLTVLEHELGHAIGLADNTSPVDLMDITLGLGMRRAPSANDVDLARMSSLQSVSRATIDTALHSLGRGVEQPVAVAPAAMQVLAPIPSQDSGRGQNKPPLVSLPRRASRRMNPIISFHRWSRPHIKMSIIPSFRRPAEGE